MAITITKGPSGIYPAYNDSFIQFSSSLSSDLYAEISVYPLITFPNAFLIYPDSDGVYTFNLKEAVKVALNENGFEDSNFFDDAYYKSITGLYHEQNIKIEVFNISTSESTLEDYEFFKSVKQVGEPIHTSPFQLLSYSPDGINHALTYFEGFPFHFDIQRVLYVSGKELTVKNTNTGVLSSAMLPTVDGAFRMNVDRSEGDNWTAANVLPLIEGLNRLEIYEDGIFKSNLLLMKKKKCSGLYLKWFNSSGGFSHFLFDKFFTESFAGKNTGLISKNEFLNIDEMTGNFRSTGKEVSNSYVAKASYNSEEYQILKDIFSSPFVQMYSSFTENIKGEFIDVNVEGSIRYKSKKGFNQIVITVDLPKGITAKL